MPLYPAIPAPATPYRTRGIGVPANPAVGDIREEVDANNIRIQEWFWNGTYWLSTQDYLLEYTNTFFANNINYNLLNLGVGRSNYFLCNVFTSCHFIALNNANNYWQIELYSSINTNLTLRGAINTADSLNQKIVALNTHILRNQVHFWQLQVKKAGSGAAPGDLRLSVVWYFREARI